MKLIFLTNKQKIQKICLLFFLPAWFVFAHPFFVSVTDIKYNHATKAIEISCKMFTNDLEGALKKTSGKSLDLLNPKDKKEVEAVLSAYIKKRLVIQLNNKPINYSFMGFEKEEDAIWTYFEFNKVEQPKQVSVDNKLLYDFLKDQTNIVNVEVSGTKKSYKVLNPESSMSFEFR